MPGKNGSEPILSSKVEYRLSLLTDLVKGPDDNMWVRLTIAIGPLATALYLPPNQIDKFIGELAPALKEASVKARTTTLTE